VELRYSFVAFNKGVIYIEIEIWMIWRGF